MNLDEMGKILNASCGDLYGELRWQANIDTRLVLLNGDLIANTQQSASGLSSRVFCKGYWGFSSSAEASLPGADRCLDAAIRNARFLAHRSQKKSSNLFLGAVKRFDKSYGTQKEKKSVDFWINWLSALDGFLVSKYGSKILSRQVVLAKLEMEKKLVTTMGARVSTLVPRAHLRVQMTVESTEGPVAFAETWGGLGEFEDYFGDDVTNYESKLNAVYTHVCEKAKGVLPEAGVHDVILAPDLAGILAHEAVGHTVEADFVLGGSVAGDLVGSRVASDLVTLVDFAHTYAGEPAPQPVHVDDEGTEGKDTVVIFNGILKRFMNNRETAHHFHQEATGHARAFRYSDEPLIRMRNTAILPGKSTLNEMIGSIQNGYFLATPGNGQADTTGEFMFAVNRGYEIKDGKLGRPLRQAVISGVAFEMLKSVSMVSSDFKWESSGYCGKKQPMPVGMGGPALKCRVTVGGK